jgi:glycosyltransferase involved in cell wall biosynthesis
MAMGKAIIAPDVSGIRDFVTDGETVLLYKPYDPCSLAARMAHLLNSPVSGDIINRKAHAHVTENFSERVMGEKFAEMVNQFILTDHSKVAGVDN